MDPSLNSFATRSSTLTIGLTQVLRPLTTEISSAAQWADRSERTRSFIFFPTTACVRLPLTSTIKLWSLTAIVELRFQRHNASARHQAQGKEVVISLLTFLRPGTTASHSPLRIQSVVERPLPIIR